MLNAAAACAILKSYVAYYTHARTRRSLDKDTPQSRPAGSLDDGPVMACPKWTDSSTGTSAAHRSGLLVAGKGRSPQR